MINWFDMPDEGLSNGGLFEVKELEVTENGTYETKGEMYNKVVVNVEGGGGSSDFSTAEVTYRLTFTALEEEKTGVRFRPPVAIANNEITFASSFIPVEDIPQGSTSVDIKCSIPLYKNKTTVTVRILAMETNTSIYVYQGGPITATGNVTITEDAIANITGDCVITFPVGVRK